AVWLAAFVPHGVKSALDVGIGTGGVSVCIGWRYPTIKITGIDVSDDMLNECAINAELNNISISLVKQDILTWKTDMVFDVVVSNPPYFKGNPAKHNAHHNVDLRLWTQACMRRVKPRGWFCTIVDATQTASVLSEMANKCGDIDILPLFSNKNTAERVLLRGRVGTKGGTTLFAGININAVQILHDGLTIDEYLTTLKP
ncbi:MAG: methyltransferase, partial [Alphaproteobacteria bacterium]